MFDKVFRGEISNQNLVSVLALLFCVDLFKNNNIDYEQWCGVET